VLAPPGPRRSTNAQIGFEHRLDKSEKLSVRWETVQVSLKDAYKIRRIYRRLAKMRGRGRLCRLTVFVRHETVVRLLEFLGYRQEEQTRYPEDGLRGKRCGFPSESPGLYPSDLRH
jgi:hypothetical protein